MDRRAFLTRLSAAAVAGALLPRSATVPAAYADGDRLRDLPEVRSTGGLLDYRLDMAAAQVRLRDRVLTLDTYNGGLPGPILRVRPGDRMRLLLRNLMRPMGIPLNKLPRCARRTPVTRQAPPAIRTARSTVSPPWPGTCCTVIRCRRS